MLTWKEKLFKGSGALDCIVFADYELCYLWFIIHLSSLKALMAKLFDIISAPRWSTEESFLTLQTLYSVLTYIFILTLRLLPE